jgi:Cu2+-exporting ATPase
LLWAAVYNFAAIPLAALGMIPPWLAALGMSTSSVLVVLNALRVSQPLAEPAIPTTGSTTNACPVTA